MSHVTHDFDDVELVVRRWHLGMTPAKWRTLTAPPRNAGRARVSPQAQQRLDLFVGGEVHTPAEAGEANPM